MLRSINLFLFISLFVIILSSAREHIQIEHALYKLLIIIIIIRIELPNLQSRENGLRNLKSDYDPVRFICHPKEECNRE